MANQQSIGKDIPHHMSAGKGKCKLKQQWEATPHAAVSPNPGHCHHHILEWKWSNRKSHPLWVRPQSGTATLGESLEVSYKNKHAFTIILSNCTPWYLPESWKLMFTQKPIHVCYSNLSIVVKTLKQPRYTSIGKW